MILGYQHHLDAAKQEELYRQTALECGVDPKFVCGYNFQNGGCKNSKCECSCIAAHINSKTKS